MATGIKQNNVCVFPDATSWEDRYQINISGGSLTNITLANFFVMPLNFPGYEGVSPAFIWYLGTGAITTTEIDNFPQGTVLFAPNIGTPTIYIKESTTTWNAIT